VRRSSRQRNPAQPEAGCREEGSHRGQEEGIRTELVCNDGLSQMLTDRSALYTDGQCELLASIGRLKMSSYLFVLNVFKISFLFVL